MLDSAYNQSITYWDLSTPNGEGGYTFSTPRVIFGRWENKVEKFTSPSGEELVSKAVVYVLEDLNIEGYLFEGESTATDPQTLPGAYRISGFLKTPDLRNVSVERRTFLT